METSKQSTGETLFDLTSYVADTPASPLALLGPEEEQTIQDTYGHGYEKPLANYDLNMQYWKMYEATFLSDLMQYSETLPQSGMTRNGLLYERQQSAHLIAENGSSSWPTPTRAAWCTATSMDAARRLVSKRGRSSRLVEEVALAHPDQNGFLNPVWVEWLMGFPTGWTDLKDSETP